MARIRSRIWPYGPASLPPTACPPRNALPHPLPLSILARHTSVPAWFSWGRWSRARVLQTPVRSKSAGAGVLLSIDTTGHLGWHPRIVLHIECK